MMKTLMKLLLLSFLLASLTTARAEGGHFEKIWEISGVKNPESVAYDARNNVLYVSSVNGPPADKDGNGFISRISLDGKMLTPEWITGLNAPKGMYVFNGKLYVSDIDTLVVIDIASGKISHRYTSAEGKFFNDVAAGADGTVYVSDSAAQTLYRLRNGHFEAWLTDAKLNSPNGLLVEKDRLLVTSTGTFTQQGPQGDGQLLAVSLADKSITSASGGKALGNLDGLEPDGDKGYYITDWPAGKLLYLPRSGTVRELLSVEPGTADLEYIPSKHLIVIPLMMSSHVVAYRVN
jgi:hypothetical protein